MSYMTDMKVWSGLHNAAANGDLMAVKKILEGGPGIIRMDSNDEGWFGDTALHLAAMKGHHAIVVYLTSHGADVNANNLQGMNPVHYAAAFGHFDCVQALIQANADPNQKTKTGLSLQDFCFSADIRQAIAGIKPDTKKSANSPNNAKERNPSEHKEKKSPQAEAEKVHVTSANLQGRLKSHCRFVLALWSNRWIGVMFWSWQEWALNRELQVQRLIELLDEACTTHPEAYLNTQLRVYEQRSMNGVCHPFLHPVLDYTGDDALDASSIAAAHRWCQAFCILMTKCLVLISRDELTLSDLAKPSFVAASLKKQKDFGVNLNDEENQSLKAVVDDWRGTVKPTTYEQALKTSIVALVSRLLEPCRTTAKNLRPRSTRPLATTEFPQAFPVIPSSRISYVSRYLHLWSWMTALNHIPPFSLKKGTPEYNVFAATDIIGMLQMVAREYDIDNEVVIHYALNPVFRPVKDVQTVLLPLPPGMNTSRGRDVYYRVLLASARIEESTEPHPVPIRIGPPILFAPIPGSESFVDKMRKEWKPMLYDDDDIAGSDEGIDMIIAANEENDKQQHHSASLLPPVFSVPKAREYLQASSSISSRKVLEYELYKHQVIQTTRKFK